MSNLIIFAFATNAFTSIIALLLILEDNDYNFIKWVKRSFKERNWFGKLQICLAIIWMLPVFVVCSIAYPIGYVIAKVIVGMLSIYMKIVDLGKK